MLPEALITEYFFKYGAGFASSPRLSNRRSMFSSSTRHLSSVSLALTLFTLNSLSREHQAFR